MSSHDDLERGRRERFFSQADSKVRTNRALDPSNLSRSEVERIRAEALVGNHVMLTGPEAECLARLALWAWNVKVDPPQRPSPAQQATPPGVTVPSRGGAGEMITRAEVEEARQEAYRQGFDAAVAAMRDEAFGKAGK